jgi:hypothetical protein
MVPHRTGTSACTWRDANPVRAAERDGPDLLLDWLHRLVANLVARRPRWHGPATRGYTTGVASVLSPELDRRAHGRHDDCPPPRRHAGTRDADLGESLRAIAESMNLDGVSTAQGGGARWYAATVRQVLLRTS